MKELSIEEKAKRYDEVVERAKEKYAMFEGMKHGDILEDVFPELKESEDERIRKAIHIYLDWLDGRKDYAPKGEFSIRDMIAWIEKQGDKDKFIKKELGCIKGYREKAIKRLEELEKQGEQKPTNKIEPKFKAGNWIVWQDKSYKVNYNGCGYELIDQNGLSTSLEYGTIDEGAHLWTIQDAKDGDVLVADDGSSFIYNGYLEEKQWPFAYGGTNIRGWFYTSGGLLPFTHQKVVPATKEQRDLLFQKMTEAGYEWDANKLELKKIDMQELVEQKPAWSEEDEKMFNSALWHIKNSCGNQGKNSGEFEVYNWLKTIKYRYLPQPKQEWSEKDERIYQSIMDDTVQENQLSGKQTDWLRDIKYRYFSQYQNRWKPTELQMDVLLDEVNAWTKGCPKQKVLESLYQDLKKLKE